MELYYMNKTNISWLRDNRELYLIEIEIKRGPNNARIAHSRADQTTMFAVHVPRENRIDGARPQP